MLGICQFYIKCKILKFMQGGSILGHKNESLVNEWLTDDRLMLLECWARDGIKMREMADRIGISNSMFVEWRKEYPEIVRTGPSGGFRTCQCGRSRERQRLGKNRKGEREGKHEI